LQNGLGIGPTRGSSSSYIPLSVDLPNDHVPDISIKLPKNIYTPWQIYTSHTRTKKL